MRKTLYFLVYAGAALIVLFTVWSVLGPARLVSNRVVAHDYLVRQTEREDFRDRVRDEQADNHPELMNKFRVMEKFVDHMPATMRRLSSALLAESEQESQERHDRRAQEILAKYRHRRAEQALVVAAIKRRLGKKFQDLTAEEYAQFVDGLDLSREDDLWKWSHLTGITIVGVNQKSIFFYMNAHLLKDTRAAVAMSYAQLVALKRGYDEITGMPTLRTRAGRTLGLREVPADTMRRSVRAGIFSHDEGFAESRTVLEALEPYLVELGQIPNREAIAKGLQALPLSVVKAYRGKAIYLTTRPGRSYAVGMPVSNSIYKGFVGMQAGFFLDHNRSSVTTHNLVHELGHVIDYTVIAGQYGSYVHPYQVPTFRKQKAEKDRIFGSGDANEPRTAHGYVSEYAKTNAQESFAEHFAHYILNKERFRQLAQAEASAGYTALMDKYRFLETLLERTPVRMIRLSPPYLKELEAAGGTR